MNVEKCMLLSLSDEILLHIFTYLDSNVDLIHLSKTCTRLNNLTRDRSLCVDFKLPWNAKIQRATFTWYFKDRIRANLIRKLDLTDVYWIPSGVIKDVCLGLTNLNTLLTAGACLRWTHLSQILKSLSNVTKLSWSWDSFLEESVRKTSTVHSVRYKPLLEFRAQFGRLTHFLVHIPPEMKSASGIVISSYVSMGFLISLCNNLQTLCIISWPQTMYEERYRASFYREAFFEDKLDLPNLTNVIFNVEDPPRIKMPALISNIERNFVKYSTAPIRFWTNHPLYQSQSGIRPFSRRTSSLNCVPGDFSNSLNLRETQEYVVSLAEDDINMMVEGLSSKAEGGPPLKCKHLKIRHGPPSVVSLTKFLDCCPELESLHISAFNYKLNWISFVSTHPKLKAVNVQSVQEANYCIGLSQQRNLNRLSVFTDVLSGFYDEKVCSDYFLSRQLSGEIESSELNSNSTQPKDPRQDDIYRPFKKKRVGVSEPCKLLNPSGSLGKGKGPTTNRSQWICGLHLLTQYCSGMEEFEIRSTSSPTRAGKPLVDSLFGIAKWKNLRKLTLESLPPAIHSGKFLVDICKDCTKLKMLRLTNLGSHGKCSYKESLCSALLHCKNLKDFRLDQNYIGTCDTLFSSLASCSKLERCLIWTETNSDPLDLPSVKNLFNSCQALVFFNAVIGPTTKSDCVKIRKALESEYKSSRPALNIIIANTVNEDFPPFKSIHYRQMISDCSQVCELLDFPLFSEY